MKRNYNFQKGSVLLFAALLFISLSSNGQGYYETSDFKPDQIAGKWSWVDGQQLELFTDGSLKVWSNGTQINSGGWECTDKNSRSYTFRHQKGGWIDNVVMSADFNTLSGKNQTGFYLSGKRIRVAGKNIFDPKVISGRWNWVNGQQLELFTDGSFKVWSDGAQINSGRWECTDKNSRNYTFRHQQGGWVDNVVLSPDFNTLSGKNQTGFTLSGKRIQDAGNAMFDPNVISGRWNWVAGQQLELFNDGSFRVWSGETQINSGSWECTDKISRSYTFRHQQGGWVDNVVISSDFNQLTGTNQHGNPLSGSRIR